MGSTIIATFLPIIAVVGALAIVVFLRSMTANSRNKYFEQLARETTLKYTAPESSWWKETFPSLEGQINGRHTTLGMFAKGGYRHRHYYTFISMETQNGNYTLGLSREDAFSKVGKLLGGQDIEVGDEAFDKKFIVKGNDDHFIRKVLNHSLKRLLLEKRPLLKGKIELKPRELYYEEMYILQTQSNLDKTKEILRLLETIADNAEFEARP